MANNVVQCYMEIAESCGGSNSTCIDFSKYQLSAQFF